LPAARSLAATSIALLVLGGGLLALLWGLHKYQRLISPRAVAIASGTQPWTTAAGAAASAPSDPAEPPMARSRAASELRNPNPPTPASLEKGRRAFMDYCATCHGLDGRGDGPLAGKSILPPPDLTANAGRRTEGYLYATIRNGGAVMPPLGGMIPPEERWDIVNYLRSIAPPVQPGPAAPEVEPPAAAVPVPAAPESAAAAQPLPAGDIDRGANVFQEHCALCHDPTSSAVVVGPGLEGLFRWPPHQLSDGTEHRTHSMEVIRRQIADGGGAMAPMGPSLTEEELADLLAYLQTL
jgi:mono/diheme cytochrome c family protein